MNTIHLYFCEKRQPDKWIKGDRYFIELVRRIIRRKKTSGVEKVFINLRKGFDELKIRYAVNTPFEDVKPGEPVVVLGAGRYALEGYTQLNLIIGGIGLMTHPSEWPTLCQDYPVVKYLQHSEWANNIYIPYYGKEVCQQWPAGIETDKWAPARANQKTADILIYNKIRWEHDKRNCELREPIISKLQQDGLTYRELVYGQYKEADYYEALTSSRAMIFLCEHESQGFACCEALSMNVPVFAWDQGYCLDPNRFKWNDPVIPATSIPFFDERCGMSFKDIRQFNDQFSTFWNNTINEKYSPRQYVLENLTLKKSAECMLEIIRSVYK